MKDSTRKLRMLESDTIGTFVSKTLGAIRSTGNAIDQAPGALFTPINKAIGVLVKSDMLTRIKFLKTELEKCELNT